MAFLDLLCIGAQKAGTTWFYSMLSQHPDVFRAPIRECHYFNSLDAPDRERRVQRIKGRLTKRIEAQKNANTPSVEKIAWLESLAEDERILTANWYEQIFSGPGSEGKIRFEKTPAYSALSLERIKEVRSLLGVIPIVHIIRDPVNRMLSQIRASALRRFRNETMSEREWNSVYSRMPERGDYKTDIPRWLSVFPEENMHFIPFKRIPTEPESVMREVEGLVGLRPHKYRNPRAERSQKKRIDVPPSVIDRITDHVAPQYVFLERHFGKEFVDRI